MISTIKMRAKHPCNQMERLHPITS